MGGYGVGYGTWRRRGGGGGFNPVSALFGAGEPGYLVPFLPGTVWKDAARTVPCTAQDDLIYVADDISGNGNHWVQSIESKRFKWQTDGTYYWGQPDGLDDFMASIGTVDFSSSDKLTVWSGFRKTTDAVVGIVVETSAAPTTTPGTFSVSAPPVNGNAQVGFIGRGSSAFGLRTAVSTAPATLVTAVAYDIAGATVATEILPQINGAAPSLTSTGGPLGGGNFGNQTVYAGGRGGTTFFFSGRLYPQIARGGGATPADLIAQTTAWINQRTGAY